MASAPPAWSLDRLERALRKALLSDSRIRLGELRSPFLAQVTYGSEAPRISVDQHKIGVRTAVLHELIHVVLDQELSRYDRDLEECIVEALETLMDNRIADSRRRSLWWRQAIERRLK